LTDVVGVSVTTVPLRVDGFHVYVPLPPLAVSVTEEPAQTLVLVPASCIFGSGLVEIVILFVF
jgi:hypothetical protein